MCGETLGYRMCRGGNIRPGTLISNGSYDKHKSIYICCETLRYRMCRGGNIRPGTLISTGRYDNYKSIYMLGGSVSLHSELEGKVLTSVLYTRCTPCLSTTLLSSPTLESFVAARVG